jgi:hypothetical protein
MPLDVKVIGIPEMPSRNSTSTCITTLIIFQKETKVACTTVLVECSPRPCVAASAASLSDGIYFLRPGFYHAHDMLYHEMIIPSFPSWSPTAKPPSNPIFVAF